MKYIFNSLILLFSTTLILAQTRPPESEYGIRSRAESIHESIITIDTHNDFELENFTTEKNYTQNLETQVNLPKMVSGNLDVSWLVVFTGQGELNKSGYKKAYTHSQKKFDAIHRFTKELAADKIELALTAEDVVRIHDSGKKVAMIGVENAYPIGEDLDRIEEFYDKGARYMSLAHNGHNQFADSHSGEKEGVWLHNGLSDLGKKAIEEMNRLGIMIDLSHPSKEANIQTIKLSKAPVIASHSSSRALSDVSRNLDDEVLLMIKENGGVVQTVAVGTFLNSDKFNAFIEASRPILEEIASELNATFLTIDEIGQLTGEDAEQAYINYEKIMKISEDRTREIAKIYPKVSVSDFIDHIDYMVKLMGIDHVGISSDFDGGGGIVDWMDASESLNVTYELVKRGYTKQEIEKLWGGNLLRVMREVKLVSKKMK
ncbi:dipeptidase [Lutimonas zeaxanthinifaciens]|uniref:dipeptidase n=1 Tax=Lutimonas zeaxanthinifaciens TaxID=3060215 RepID=UPI00265CBBE1|nr:dipeptidase [Lutimonas sp. YSD2104]WKK64636.1 dipeptidase [Lutimonas sp. YSD2104]